MLPDLRGWPLLPADLPPGRAPAPTAAATATTTVVRTTCPRPTNGSTGPARSNGIGAGAQAQIEDLNTQVGVVMVVMDLAGHPAQGPGDEADCGGAGEREGLLLR